LVYEVLSLERPYYELPKQLFKMKVYHDGYRPVVPTNWPSSLVFLLETGWNEKIHHRPTMEGMYFILNDDIIPKLVPPKQEPSKQKEVTDSPSKGFNSSGKPSSLRRLAGNSLKLLSRSKTATPDSSFETTRLVPAT
jgi:hypothetical protein